MITDDPEHPTLQPHPFDCDACCRNHYDGDWEPIERAARGCSRADLPAVQWDVSRDRVCFHLGRHKEPSLIGKADSTTGPWDAPFEDPAEGCPGGYAICPFVLSVLRFYRRRDKQGGRVPNPLFERADWLTQTAVMFLEQYEDAWFAAWEAVIHKPRKE